MKQMKSLFEFHETLEVVNNDVSKLVENATDAQRVTNKEAKKKESIQESNNHETLKLEDLVGSLEAHDIRIVERKGVQDSIQALQTQAWNKHCGSNKFKGKGDKTQSKKSWLNPQKHKVGDKASESSKRGEGKSYQKYKEKKGVHCYNCEKWGHLAKNCWYNKVKGVTKGKEEGANLAHQDSDEYEDMMVMDIVADDYVDSNIWFLDSG
ncbi:uncharacterized protein LOC127137984 [Lathyrus oleraceus]|uniref:uncharacterized protein LOC127137984 n=1 Tax=Pisum sativum TaxID=3888 RepID=UPI0021D04012|nr:uncharacterized protein LOC127137984 [Pisum sativum]